MLKTRFLQLVIVVCSVAAGFCNHGFAGQEEPDFQYVDGLLKEQAPNHCGLYSLFAVASALEVKADLEHLVHGDFVSSQYGSSAFDLGRAAKTLGLYTATVTGWNVGALRNSGQPALLNLGVSENAACGHWVAWLGDQDGQALIYDPLSELECVPYGVLLARWKGVAVIVSKQPLGLATRVGASIAWLSWLLVPMCFVAVARNSKWASDHCFQPTTGQVFFGASVICLMVLAWFGLDCVTNDMNTVRNHDLTRVSNCQISSHSLDLPRTGNHQIQKVIDDHRSVIVDARPAARFRQGAIPGSVNIPVNASLFDFVASVRRLDRDSPTVVLCERASCQWDQIVASRLLCSGFNNVSVYEPGIEGYFRHSMATGRE